MDKVNSYMDKVNLKLQDALLTAKRLSGDLERGAIPCQANPDLGPFLHEIQSLFVFLESRIEEQRRLREVTIKANAGVLLDDILYHIYDSFRLLVPYDRIGMALLEQSGTYLRARWARSSASQLRLQRGYGAPMAGSSLQTIIETRQPRIINDLEVHLAEHPDSGSTRLIVEEGFRSSLTCPLIALGKPVGFLFFSSVSPGTYRTTHVNTYLKIAEQISVIVEKGRLYEELNRCNQILESEISERKKAEEVAVAARTTAEAATRAKSEFLAYMSHEIRTPMNGIIGMTELALETPLSQQQRAYLTLVKSSADSLLTVINDVLDFSKIEAGKLDIDEVPFDLRECLDDTLSTLALRAYGKGLELACRIAPDVPNAVVGDSGRLRQVLVNLVGNAIKFTERGEVVVSAEVESCHEAVVSIHCSVADTGIGIAPEKARTIFEPFVQCNGLAMRKFGGTGLGLTISAKLTALMGGRIWVDSEVGRGSTFHFTVQLGRKHDIPPRHTGEAVRLKGLRVLIVDDNQTSRRILEEVLTGWGARPKSVDGGLAALAALESAEARGEPFAVALLDDLMPGMDGFDLAELIRREPQWSDLTLALLTSDARQGASQRCPALGISACLSKPVRRSELFDVLMRSLRPVAASVAPEAIESEEGNRPASKRLRVLLAEDHVVNQKVAARMLEHLGHQAIVVGDGKKALAALEADSFDVVLMDVQMPEMDGLEAVASLRQRERSTREHVRVIALTAYAMKGDRERCLRAGFDGYLSKPIHVNELRQALDDLVGDRDRSGDRSVQLLNRLLENCDDDVQFVRELVKSYLDTAPALLAAIDAALAVGDPARVSAEAHGLKGISQTIGIEELASTCRELEDAGRRGDLAAARALSVSIHAAWEEIRAVLEHLLGTSG